MHTTGHPTRMYIANGEKIVSANHRKEKKKHWTHTHTTLLPAALIVRPTTILWNGIIKLHLPAIWSVKLLSSCTKCARVCQVCSAHVFFLSSTSFSRFSMLEPWKLIFEQCSFIQFKPHKRSSSHFHCIVHCHSINLLRFSISIISVLAISHSIGRDSH